MDKNLVIETAYETITEALEWALGDKDETFANYVDGIVNMTDKLLEKLANTSNTKPNNEDNDWL